MGTAPAARNYWLQLADDNSRKSRHSSRSLVEQLRTTVRTEELEAVEENVANAVNNNKLLKSQRPVEFIKRKTEPASLKLAI
jgi:hypothetical protein